TADGWLQAHAYRFDKELSTFIVECPNAVWEKSGLSTISQSDGIRYCEKLFADILDGHALISNAQHLPGATAWLNFPRVHCASWHHDKVVLLGDAAATAHFSVGSGTKLAMESAVALAKHLHGEKSLGVALQKYEEERRTETLKLQ